MSTLIPPFQMHHFTAAHVHHLPLHRPPPPPPRPAPPYTSPEPLEPQRASPSYPRLSVVPEVHYARLTKNQSINCTSNAFMSAFLAKLLMNMVWRTCIAWSASHDISLELWSSIISGCQMVSMVTEYGICAPPAFLFSQTILHRNHSPDSSPSPWLSFCKRCWITDAIVSGLQKSLQAFQESSTLQF